MIASDEIEIRGLMDRYFAAVDGRDPELLRACFTEDAEFVALAGPDGNGGRPHRGIDAVVATLEGTRSYAASCHVTGNIVIEIDGDSAIADTFGVAFVVPSGLPEPGQVITRGLRYRDDLVRRADGWRILRRVHSPLWQSNAVSSPLGLPATTVSALGAEGE